MSADTEDILGRPCNVCGRPLSQPGGHAACHIQRLEREVEQLRSSLARERQRTRDGVRTPAPGYENSYISGNVHAAVCKELDEAIRLLEEMLVTGDLSITRDAVEDFLCPTPN